MITVIISSEDTPDNELRLTHQPTDTVITVDREVPLTKALEKLLDAIEEY